MKSSFKTIALVALAGLAAAVALFPEVAAAASSFVAYVGPENIASLGFVGSVATTVTKDVGYTGAFPVNTQPRGAEILEVVIPINFPAVAPVANDIQVLATLLPGVDVIDWTLHLDDIDSNGAPTASMSIGETNAALTDLAVLYKNAIVLGQTGGLQRHAAATAATDIRAIGAATRATARTIGLKWDTAAATYTPSGKGLLRLKLLG